MRHFIGLLFILIFATAAATGAPKRVALVIGTDVKFELNPTGGQANDARMVGDALREYGFEVKYGLNPSKESAARLIENFAKQLTEKEIVAIFFFAGPGYNSGGENFIVPADADRTSGEKLEKSFVSLKPLGDALKTNVGSHRILILDAVRSGLDVQWNRTNIWPRIGFAPFDAAIETLALDAGPIGGETACERQGALATAVLARLGTNANEIGVIAADLKKMLDVGGKAVLSPTLTDNRRQRFIFAPSSKVKRRKNLDADFEEFKKALKCRCGYRQSGKFGGERILREFRNDPLNKMVLEYVAKKIAEIDGRDPRCRLENAYDKAYQRKDWTAFFAATEALLDDRGEDGLKLDITLTAASVAFDRFGVDRIRDYDTAAVNYARRALAMMDRKIISKTGKWGVFDPFNSSMAARFWINNIIGLRVLENEPAVALDHLWRAVRLLGATTKLARLCQKTAPDCREEEQRATIVLANGGVRERDISNIFVVVANYYSREAIGMSARYRDLSETPTAENLGERQQQAVLSKTAAELSIDALARANRYIRQPGSKRHPLPLLIGIYNQIVPEMGEFKFTEPSADSLAERPIPVWKVLK